jgi:hypothetical protein
MNNKKLFDRVITVEPTRKNSGPDRRRDDGPFREEREEKEELHGLQISASNLKVLAIGK